jgi:hypothetical protein
VTGLPVPLQGKIPSSCWSKTGDHVERLICPPEITLGAEGGLLSVFVLVLFIHGKV